MQGTKEWQAKKRAEKGEMITCSFKEHQSQVKHKNKMPKF